MDNVTHTLAGIALADVCFRARHGRGSLALVAIAANAPDFDAVLYFFGGRDAYVFEHRGPSHGLLGFVVLTLALATIAKWIWRGRAPPIHALVSMSALGVASHVALDLPTAWGTCALSPISDARFAFDWVFIIDLFIWAALAASFVWKRRGWTPARASGLGLALCAAYLATAGIVHAAVRASVERRATLAAGPAQIVWLRVFPRPLAPFAWFGVARTSDERYLIYRVSIIEDSGPEIIATGLDLPELARARRESWVATRYLWWASAPHVEKHGASLRFRDLRFESSSLYPSPFTMRLAIDGDGKCGEHSWDAGDGENARETPVSFENSPPPASAGGLTTIAPITSPAADRSPSRR